MFDTLLFEVKSKFINNFSRRIFNKYRSCAQNDIDCLDGMFPRVYRTNKCTNIELNLISCSGLDRLEPEYLLTVAEKFLRVTSPDYYPVEGKIVRFKN